MLNNIKKKLRHDDDNPFLDTIINEWIFLHLLWVYGVILESRNPTNTTFTLSNFTYYYIYLTWIPSHK